MTVFHIHHPSSIIWLIPCKDDWTHLNKSEDEDVTIIGTVGYTEHQKDVYQSNIYDPEPSCAPMITSVCTLWIVRICSHQAEIVFIGPNRFMLQLHTGKVKPLERFVWAVF